MFIALFLIVGFIIITGIRIIQQYETGVVFQLGRYSRTLQPGLNLIIPLIEFARVVDMRVLTNDIPKQQAITKDNVPVSINGVVYFQVMDAPQRGHQGPELYVRGLPVRAGGVEGRGRRHDL